MALTQLKTAAIADDAVTTDKLANAINTERTANTAKSTNATHTGEVTGSGALTITADAVTGAKIADDAIDSEHYTDGSIDTAHIADNQITLAKMAGGTDGQIITYDASGDPVAVGPGTDGQVLTSTGAGSPPAFETLPASGRAYNIIINGDMRISQRSTSSQTNGYAALDRFRNVYSNVDENVTQSQEDVASGTTPYTLGFRKCLRITNGNQTSGDNGDTNIQIWQRIESANIVNSGWNYLSSSSYITLSFWVKSSVAQSFNCYLLNEDSTQNTYPFETGSLSADTWTKVTKTIPGNSNLTFNNDTGAGLRVAICPFNGTNRTANSLSNDTWVTFDGSNFTRDNTTTWLTTNDSTFELTGVLLETGSSASDYPHEDYNTNLRRCQRYLWKLGLVSGAWIYVGVIGNSSSARFRATFPVPMRANPTITFNSLYVDSEVSGSVETVNSIGSTHFNSDFGGRIECDISTSTAGSGVGVSLYPNGSSGYLQGDSEL